MYSLLIAHISVIISEYCCDHFIIGFLLYSIVNSLSAEQVTIFAHNCIPGVKHIAYHSVSIQKYLRKNRHMSSSYYYTKFTDKHNAFIKEKHLSNDHTVSNKDNWDLHTDTLSLNSFFSHFLDLLDTFHCPFFIAFLPSTPNQSLLLFVRFNVVNCTLEQKLSLLRILSQTGGKKVEGSNSFFQSSNQLSFSKFQSPKFYFLAKIEEIFIKFY